MLKKVLFFLLLAAVALGVEVAADAIPDRGWWMVGLKILTAIVLLFGLGYLIRQFL